MKKIFAILFFTLATFAIAATVTVNFTKYNTNVTTTPEYIPEFLRGGYTVTSEAALLTDLYNNNYNTDKNTVAVTATSLTSILYTATTVTVTSTQAAVKTALDKVKIGSIIETAHSPILQGLVRSISGKTVTVGGWYNSTTSAAVTPSPTTGTSFYINEWKASTNTLINGFLAGQTIVGGTQASGTLTLSSTSNAAKGYIILNDFTKIGGTTAPAIKMKKVTTTTGITTGAATAIAHGLTGSKILAVNAVVRATTDTGIIPGTTSPAAVAYNVDYDATNVNVKLLSDSANITGKAIDITLTFTE